MNLHQLRIFCGVVEHGSYTKAAETAFCVPAGEVFWADGT
jgi:DNA-binding transcriptional LysR family regulator